MKHIRKVLKRTWKKSKPKSAISFTYTYPAKTLTAKDKTIELHQANVNQIKAMLAVERAVYGTSQWEKSAFVREFTSTLPHLYLCAYHQTTLIGFGGVRITEQDGHITNIAILPDYQNLAIGTMLMTELETFAMRYACRSLSLEVRKSNLDAQRFYRKFGFVSLRLKPDYYEEEDGVEMKKELCAG